MTQGRERDLQGWLQRHRHGRTALPVVDWEDTPTQPRVLVECEDDAVSWAMQQTLERAGYDVATCAGPSAATRCSLLDTHQCELQAGADVIVNCIDGAHSDSPQLAPATVAAYPECPLIVDVATSRQVDGSLPVGVTVMVSPWNGHMLVDAVDKAIGLERQAPASS